MRPSLNTIMIIDDDLDLPDIIQEILVQKGYHVVIFHDAESAIKDFKKKKPNLILMDIMLPGLNGAEAIHEIRKDPSNCDIPVIFLTGLISNRESDLKEAGIHVEGLVYKSLGKPFEVPELLNMVQDLLEA